ncbi:MAG: hypothetical protein GY828_03150 [Candidatus Gracilibacteria bacterium]|nr:hypothetical protein [Candidatus Gracilibacteria bacterium]
MSQYSNHFKQDLIITTGILNWQSKNNDMVFAILSHAKTGHIFYVHQFNKMTGKWVLRPYISEAIRVLESELPKPKEGHTNIYEVSKGIFEVNVSLLPDAVFIIECFHKPIELIKVLEMETSSLNAIKTA